MICLRFYHHILMSLAVLLCMGGCTGEPTTKQLFADNKNALVADMQAMYHKIEADYLHEPLLYSAVADIDFDGIPEIFYGYQTMTGAHNKIWYRAYSLRNGRVLEAEHAPDWSTYIAGDTDCAFSTGPDSFMEGYYVTGQGNFCFVTKAYAGPVASLRTDYVFVEYADAKLAVRTGWDCDEELTPLKQAWGSVHLDTLEDDMTALLADYVASLS